MYLLLFVVEFFTLFLLSKTLTKSLSSLLLGITKSKKTTIALLALLFFPGTVVHEFSHLLSAGLMLVKTGDMELLPKATEDEIRLGSIQIAKTDLLRRAIIGVAPVLVGLAIIFGSLLYSQPFISKNLLIDVIIFYIVFEVSNTLFSSRKDLEGVVEFFIAAFFMTLAVFIVKTNLAYAFWGLLQKKEVTIFFKTADLFLVVPLIIDTTIIILVKLLLNRVYKH